VSWETSDRRQHLPSNWSTITADILKRDRECQLSYPGEWETRNGTMRCTVTATEVDHIGDRDDHDPANLRGACSACHQRRTREQAAAALAAVNAKARRPVRPHPGVIA
jgi:hypothetical protein